MPRRRPRLGSSAAEPLLLAARPLLDVGRGGRKVAVEPGEGAARIRLLPEVAERHAELQQAVRRLAALRILLVALGEGGGGAVVVLPHVIGLAEPVLRVGGERIV